VVAPRPTWPAPLGRGPLTIENRSGPRIAVPTTIPTLTLSREDGAAVTKGTDFWTGSGERLAKPLVEMSVSSGRAATEK
jgi:hypothetical protein